MPSVLGVGRVRVDVILIFAGRFVYEVVKGFFVGVRFRSNGGERVVVRVNLWWLLVDFLQYSASAYQRSPICVVYVAFDVIQE